MKDIDKRKLGFKIRLLREEKNISREQLADKLNFSKNYIYKIEAGQIGFRFETIQKIAKALSVSINELYRWEELEEISKIKDIEIPYVTKLNHLTELVERLAEIVLPDPKKLLESVPQKSEQEKLELVVELVKKLTPDQAKIIVQAIVEEHLKS